MRQRPSLLGARRETTMPASLASDTPSVSASSALSAVNSSAPLLVRGACPHDCPDTCATITEVRDGRAVRFYADAAHPVTDGWLCAKVRPYLERVYRPTGCSIPCAAWDRRAAMRRRIGSASGGTRPSARSRTRWRRIIAEDGARGDPAVLLQRHARPAAEPRRQPAALESHGRERA